MNWLSRPAVTSVGKRNVLPHSNLATPLHGEISSKRFMNSSGSGSIALVSKWNDAQIRIASPIYS